MADRYWVGGTANWDSINTVNWSTSSGGAGGASVPTSADSVIFDTSSSIANAAYTVTISGASARSCLNFTMAGPGSGNKVTWAGATTLLIYGNISLSGTTEITKSYTGSINFLPAVGTTKTITTNSVALYNVIFNGLGTSQLVDDLIVEFTFSQTTGTFDPNGKTVTTTFPHSGFYMIGNPTFYNLTLTGNNNILCHLTLYGNITVTNNLVANGYSVSKRLFISSDTVGTARTITTKTVTATNVDLQDITGAGVASWDLSAITGGSGNCGGNTLKALGDAAFSSPTTWYWHKDTGSFSTVANWFDATNGGGSVATYPPLPQDTARFDVNSFDAGSKTITQDIPRTGSINWTGATNTPTFTTSTTASVYGSMTLISGMVLTASGSPYTFMGRGSFTLDSGGKTWVKKINLDAPGGILTLKSNLTMGSTNVCVLNVIHGTFTVVDGGNNWVISAGYLWSAGTLTLGSSTHLLTGDGINTNIFQNTGTVSAGTYTIKFTGVLSHIASFAGGGATYNNFWNNTTGAYQVNVTGSNTFNDFRIDTGRTVAFTGSTTQTVTSFTAIGSVGNLITLKTITGTTRFNLSMTSGTVVCNYLDISNSNATGGATWYAGANSNNTTNNAGWLFSNPPFTGTGNLTKTITPVDMSPIVGVSSGTPATGTVGLWMFCDYGGKVSEIRLRIGSSSSNYKEYIAQTYAQWNSLVVGFLPQNGLNYLMFNLRSPDGTLGSIDWTAIAYLQIRFIVTDATYMVFDYLTASKNDNLGLNGFGERFTPLSDTTVVF